MTKPSATTTSSWRTITATALGASHVQSGLPNQDAVTTLALNGSGGAVAAVADGHGGTRYVRSNVGSALAVQIAGEAGRELISALGPKPDLKAVRTGLEGRLTPAVIERWRQQVLEDHQLHPFTAEERARGGVDLDADPTISYGCTLIVAVLGPRWLGLVQIGDGDAILVAPDGSISTPVPTDDRLVGGETTSLCLPDAVHDARIAVVGDHLPELVVLATDGYGNSFASPTWRQEAATGLLEAVRRDGLDIVGAKLPGWLADSAAAGGDDVTMALALHQGSGPPAGAAPVARSRQEPRRWPAVALAVALVLGLLTGGAAGWLARGGRTDTTTAASTSDTTDPVNAAPDTTAVATGTTPVVNRRTVLIGQGQAVTFTPAVAPADVRPVLSSVDPKLTATISVTSPISVSLANGKMIVGKKSFPIDPSGALALWVSDDGKVAWVVAADHSVKPVLVADGSSPFDWQTPVSVPTN